MRKTLPCYETSHKKQIGLSWRGGIQVAYFWRHLKLRWAIAWCLHKFHEWKRLWLYALRYNCFLFHMFAIKGSRIVSIYSGRVFYTSASCLRGAAKVYCRRPYYICHMGKKIPRTDPEQPQKKARTVPSVASVNAMSGFTSGSSRTRPSTDDDKLYISCTGP